MYKREERMSSQMVKHQEEEEEFRNTSRGGIRGYFEGQVRQLANTPGEGWRGRAVWGRDLRGVRKGGEGSGGSWGGG